jgi:hypothetical protein
LPRSEPDIRDQTLSYAARAAATARSTSDSSAEAIMAIFFSVAGEIVANGVPCPATNSPLMNRP